MTLLSAPMASSCPWCRRSRTGSSLAPGRPGRAAPRTGTARQRQPLVLGLDLRKLLHVHLHVGELRGGRRIGPAASSFPGAGGSQGGNSFSAAAFADGNRRIDRLNPALPFGLELLPLRLVLRGELLLPCFALACGLRLLAHLRRALQLVGGARMLSARAAAAWRGGAVRSSPGRGRPCSSLAMRQATRSSPASGHGLLQLLVHRPGGGLKLGLDALQLLLVMGVGPLKGGVMQSARLAERVRDSRGERRARRRRQVAQDKQQPPGSPEPPRPPSTGKRD